jgi:hypothetical protein
MMAIRASQMLHVGNGTVVVDRIQSGGPGQLNIPTERIEELGNYKAVAVIRDVPDLTFPWTSLDVSLENEALLAGSYAGRKVTDAVTNGTTTLTSATASFTSADVGRQVVVWGAGTGGADLVTTIASVTDGTTAVLTVAATSTDTGQTLRILPDGIDLATAVPIDIASQFKAGVSATDPTAVVAAVAVPFVLLESMSYSFGYSTDAQQQAQLRGDTIFYCPGALYVETAVGTGSSGQTIVTAQPAYASSEADGRRVIAVTANSTRLTLGVDYTETYGTITAGAAVTTVNLNATYASTDNLRIIYSSPTLKQYADSANEDATIKPAAVRGKDIEVYVGGYDPNDVAGSQAHRWTGVQSVKLDWKVTVEKDQEFGNYYAVAVDYTDVPDVTGSVDIKPRDPADLAAKIREAAGITDATQMLGPTSSVPLALDIVIKDAQTQPGVSKVIKRFHVADARFTLPGYTGQVKQKLTVTVPFTSDQGALVVYGA